MPDEVLDRPVPGDESQPAPLTWRDWAAPLLALALALLFFTVFGLDRAGGDVYGPGLGVTAFALAFFAAVFLILGRRARLTASALLLTAAVLCLALCCGLYANPVMTTLHCLVMLCAAPAAVFQLSGSSRQSWRDVRLVPETIGLFFRALFSRIGRPFQALRLLRRDRGGALGSVLLGLLIALPLLAVVLALLASADAVFGGLFEQLRTQLRNLAVGEWVWKVLRTVVLALLLCSGLHFVSAAPAEEASDEAPAREARALPFLLPVLLLNLVYILFVGIQFAYFFGGREAASMAGGWAEYARSGFFQLVAVAAINLLVCLAPASQRRFAAKGGTLLRIADGLMLLLTCVILASAWRRMQLYIGVYGQSLLRLMTLWGMGLIAALLLAAAWKLICPRFRFFQALFGLGLAAWCVFGLANPAALVANYNADAWLDGRIEELDISYLEELSTDALPALQRLEAESEDPLRRDELRAASYHLTSNATYLRFWTNQRISFLRFR